MSKDEIIRLLRNNNLSNYIDLFENNHLLDYDVLKTVTNEDYLSIGISNLGDRKKLLSLFSNTSTTTNSYRPEPQPQPSASTGNIKVTVENNNKYSDKNRLAAAVLCFFLGCISAHRFYAGKIGSAIFQIILNCCFGIGFIWVALDFIIILCGWFRDREDKIIYNWN